jgi:hypothetical protein
MQSYLNSQYYVSGAGDVTVKGICCEGISPCGLPGPFALLSTLDPLVDLDVQIDAEIMESLCRDLAGKLPCTANVHVDIGLSDHGDDGVYGGRILDRYSLVNTGEPFGIHFYCRLRRRFPNSKNDWIVDLDIDDPKAFFMLRLADSFDRFAVEGTELLGFGNLGIDRRNIEEPGMMCVEVGGITFSANDQGLTYALPMASQEQLA